MTRAEIAQVHAAILQLHHDTCEQGGQSFALPKYAREALDTLEREQASDLPALDTAYPTQARDAGA